MIGQGNLRTIDGSGLGLGTLGTLEIREDCLELKVPLGDDLRTAWLFAIQVAVRVAEADGVDAGAWDGLPKRRLRGADMKEVMAEALDKLSTFEAIQSRFG